MKDYVIYIILGGCFLFLGWSCHVLYQYYTSPTIEGIWTAHNFSSRFEASIYASDRENRGKWICVNIERSTIQEILDTCQHEVGHELFARYCQKNMTKCLNDTLN
jgi:hypothetical protein